VRLALTKLPLSCRSCHQGVGLGEPPSAAPDRCGMSRLDLHLRICRCRWGNRP